MAGIVFKVECITNLHVGNGEVNYNIIDNEVERDPVTGYPTINASGVKGALREYLIRNNQQEEGISVSEKNMKSEMKRNMDTWLGKGGDDSTQGRLKILAAEMLTMPARASAYSDAPFILVSTENAISRCCQMMKTFAGKELVKKECTNFSGVQVEGKPVERAVEIWGSVIGILESKQFNEISLPVMARNRLENGESKNLWYEEIVPHESIFYFPVVTEDCNVRELEEFKKAFNGKVVQFGGNASIGYGLCRLTAM